MIKDVEIKTGTNKKTGKDYTRYGISIEGDERVFGSFDTNVGEAANEYYHKDTEVRLGFVANGKYWNVTSLSPALTNEQDDAVNAPKSDVNGDDQLPI